MRRLEWTFAMLMAAFALAACGSNASPSHTGAGSVSLVPSSTTASAAVDPLTGTWRSTFTCNDVAKALDRTGLQKYQAKVLPQFGDCPAAGGVMHQTLAFADGALTITGVDGSTSSAPPYQIVNGHTYVEGFLRNTYTVKGNRLIFDDTQIIKALYPYGPTELLGEHALDVGLLQSAPFGRVS